jgi:Lipocalin-like domain
MNRILAGLVSAAILLSIFATHSSDAISQQTHATRLVGTWSLVSWYNISDDGKAMPQPVDGNDPLGVLMFDDRGHFSLVIASDRPRWKSPDRMQGTNEENKLAARGTLAYYGTYLLNEADHTFTLNVERSLHPNLNGTSQKRSFTLIGDELKYSTPPFRYPKGTFTGYFVWKRVP